MRGERYKKREVRGGRSLIGKWFNKTLKGVGIIITPSKILLFFFKSFVRGLKYFN